MLRAEGVNVNRKRMQLLMRLMGIARARAEAETRKPAPGHRNYPYLLRNLTIERATMSGDRHHLQSDRAGLSPSGGDHRLGVAHGARSGCRTRWKCRFA